MSAFNYTEVDFVKPEMKCILLPHVCCYLALWMVMARCGEICLAETLRVPEQYRSIQEAIDQASPGDLVLVQQGRYTERIVLGNGVTVRSAGMNEQGKLGLKRAEDTVIDGGGESGGKPGVQMATGSVLDGFTVTEVGKYDATRWEKHFASSGNQQKHSLIGASGIAGISIDGVNCEVMHNIVHHVGYTGIAIQGASASASRVIDNVCYRNMGGGIGFMDQAQGYAEGNECFENFYAGIGHENASPIIIGNVCRNNIRAGIGISEGACPIVMRNKCFENRRAGIGTRTGKTTRPLIQDNDCYRNGMAGIGTDEEASPVIRGNRCYRNKMAGIGSRSNATPMIVANECYENQRSGIGQEGDAEPTLIENHCHHNQLSGLGFNACDDGKCLAIGNRVLENGKVAVGIQAGWKVTFLSNQFERTGGLPPIVMVFEGATAIFRDNVISGQGVAGVRVAGTVVLEGNRFVGKEMRPSGPPNFGVWALANATVTLKNNDFSDWRHAVQATQSRVQMQSNQVSGFHRYALHLQQLKPGSFVLDNLVTAAHPNDALLSKDVQSGLAETTRIDGNTLVPFRDK
ncbi:right-handed parallel beta-helix repeat-containing protein [bacterium]|nr:right-handed parallel beta-helix repeat-containing protein [bacterium]